MEIEARVKVENLSSLKEKLEKDGAVFEKEKKQHDVLFRPKGKEFAEQGPGDFALRIRRSGNKSILSFKALTDKAGVWIEHETEISNPDEAAEILDLIGLGKCFDMHKTRIEGKINEFVICLDDIKELGTYMEVEIIDDNAEQAKKKIIEFLQKYGFEEKDIIHKGYVRILFEKHGTVVKGVD